MAVGGLFRVEMVVFVGSLVLFGKFFIFGALLKFYTRCAIS